MSKRITIYGFILALLMLALKVLQYEMVFINHSLELYGGAFAVLFSVLGIYIGKKLAGEKKVVVEKIIMVPQPVPAIAANIDYAQIEKLGISKREYEILEHMAQGCSNQEIADRAFVSVSTVKTHVSNLFVKLDVQRRTQAIKKAKEIGIIP